jgi:hypothetical protein
MKSSNFDEALPAQFIDQGLPTQYNSSVNPQRSYAENSLSSATL